MQCQSCESAPGLHCLEVVISYDERMSRYVHVCEECLQAAHWYCEEHRRMKVLVNDEEFNTEGQELVGLCLECCKEIALLPSDEEAEAYLQVFEYCECEHFVAFGLSVAGFWEVPKAFSRARRLLYALAVGASIEDTSVERTLTNCLMQATGTLTVH